MVVDKRYALLDTDFLFKSHLARDKNDCTLSDLVIDFEDYEFFCHEKIKDELARHDIFPDPNPWLADKIENGRVKLYSDRDILNELQKLYGIATTSMYFTLLKTSCDTFNRGFFEEYYGSMNDIDGFEDMMESFRC